LGRETTLATVWKTKKNDVKKTALWAYRIFVSFHLANNQAEQADGRTVQVMWTDSICFVWSNSQLSPSTCVILALNLPLENSIGQKKVTNKIDKDYPFVSAQCTANIHSHTAWIIATNVFI